MRLEKSFMKKMAEELDAIDAYKKNKMLKKENLKVLMKKLQIVLTREKKKDH